MFRKVIILFVALFLVNAKLGIDVSQPHSEEVLKCFINQGYSFIVARGYKSFGAVDTNAIGTLTNAQKAGMSDTGIYMFPCTSTSKTAQSQVSELINGIKGVEYNRIWIDVETNQSPNCGWTKDYEANCNFMKSLVSAIKATGKEVGIYASHYMWTSIFGSADNCAAFSTIPLWYAHYDHTPSFTDFQAFGGWKTPYAKQYAGTTSMCGGSVDLNFKN